MTESNIKTPDYDVFPKGNRVVIEVKELQTNNDDKAAAWCFRCLVWSEQTNSAENRGGLQATEVQE